MATTTLTSASVQCLMPPQDLQSSVTALGPALSAINAALNSINSINVPSNLQGYNVQQHVNDAKNNSVYWTSNVLPAIQTSLSDIKAYSALFNSLYTALSNEAVAIQANENDGNSKAQFAQNISLLMASSKTLYDQSVLIQTPLSTFQKQNLTISQEFQADQNQVNVSIQADQSQLNMYNQQMGQLQNQLRDAQAKKDQLESVWMSILTFGISQLVSLCENLQGQINELNNRISNIYNDEQQEQQELYYLTQLSGSLSLLLGVTTQLSGLMTGFVTMWQSLSDNLSELYQMEYISPDDNWAQSNLQAINLEWQTISNQVSNF